MVDDSPACPRLRKALAGGYHYRRVQVAGERYADRPEKNECPPRADALQYLMLGGGEARALLSRGEQQTVTALVDFNPMSGRRGRCGRRPSTFRRDVAVSAGPPPWGKRKPEPELTPDGRPILRGRHGPTSGTR